MHCVREYIQDMCSAEDFGARLDDSTTTRGRAAYLYITVRATERDEGERAQARDRRERREERNR